MLRDVGRASPASFNESAGELSRTWWSARQRVNSLGENSDKISSKLNSPLMTIYARPQTSEKTGGQIFEIPGIILTVTAWTRIGLPLCNCTARWSIRRKAKTSVKGKGTICLKENACDLTNARRASSLYSLSIRC